MVANQTVRIKFLAEYRELFNQSWRNIVFFGGRGSGKSQHTAMALLLRGRQGKLRIVCTRETVVVSGAVIAWAFPRRAAR